MPGAARHITLAASCKFLIFQLLPRRGRVFSRYGTVFDDHMIQVNFAGRYTGDQIKRADFGGLARRKDAAGTHQQTAVMSMMLARQRIPVTTPAGRNLIRIRSPKSMRAGLENPVRYVNGRQRNNRRLLSGVRQVRYSSAQPGAHRGHGRVLIDREGNDAVGREHLPVCLWLKLLRATERAPQFARRRIVTHHRAAASTFEMVSCRAV